MLKLIIILTTVLVCSSADALAVGALFARPLNGTQTHKPMDIIRYDAVVDIQDHVATTVVNQEIYNHLTTVSEATFIFPLPPGAMIVDMGYEFNGKWYTANVRERQEAQQSYNSKVRRLIDPALLQEWGDNVYKLDIAPINGKSIVKFRITYTEFIPYVAGELRYKHLLRTTGLSPKPLERMTLSARVRSQLSIASVTTPDYQAGSANVVTQHSGNEYTISFGDEAYVPSKDYRIYVKNSRNDVAMQTLTYVPTESDSFGMEPFFATWITPPDEAIQRVPTTWVITADVSSSMNHERMTSLRTALHAFLDNLKTGDRFNIVTFSTLVSSFRPDVIDVTSENIGAAREWVNRLTSMGLTNFYEALKTSLRQSWNLNGKSSNVLVFLTDGEPSYGETRPAVLLDSVQAWNKTNVRIHTIGIALQQYSLLEMLASRNGGTFTHIEEDDEISLLVGERVVSITADELKDPYIDYHGLTVMDVFPNQLPSISATERITQVGRYGVGGEYLVELRATLGQDELSLQRMVLFGSPSLNNRAVARLWARAKINDLLSEILRVGESKELVDAVIDLSIRFGILTKYTALYSDPDVDEPDQPTDVVTEPRPLEVASMSVAPNPVTESAVVSVTVPDAAIGAMIVVRLYDVHGRCIGTVYDGIAYRGLSFRVDAFNVGGSALSAGAYTLVSTVNGVTITVPFIVRL
ncbi:MAG TPA: hypothetical protein DIS79_09890 [Bacteroidetes bacterium]|nr:hypothetical protein [Bacteroidota bacterium]HRK05388.1 VIT and VWA domain-containing protein [Chlorobiota bacterium]